MSETGPEPEHSWDEGWDGHERAQQRRLAKLPLWKKLQWLEEMNRVIRHLRAQSTTSYAPPPDPAHLCEPEHP